VHITSLGPITSGHLRYDFAAFFETDMPRSLLFALLSLVSFFTVSDVTSADDVKHDVKSVTYDDHIAAIFKRHCLQCHGESKQEAGLSLATFAAATKGSSGGAVMVAGRSSSSRLFQAITAEDPAERMPPENDPLPKEQIAMIKTWIDTGLKQNAGSAATPARTLTFVPSSVGKTDGPPPMPDKLPSIERKVTKRPFPVLALASSLRVPLIAVGTYERVDFLDPATRELIGSLPFPEGEPQVLSFSRSGAVLLAAGGRPVQNGSAVLFDVKSGKRLAEIGNETDSVLAADLSPDERFVAIGGSGRVVKIFSTANGSLLHTLVKHTDWVTAMAYSPDGKLLASADRVGNIHLWDATSGGVVLPLSEHKGAVRALAWRSDSQILASCGEDGLVVWWEISKGWPAMTKADAHPPIRPAGLFGRIPNGVLDAAFGPKGELVTCGRDQTVRIWGTDGNALKTIRVTSDSSQNATSSGVRVLPLQVILTNDGSTIIAGDSAGQIHSWPSH